ncbi:hypothetical protein D3C86_1254380 [compost metagenome]
MIAAAVVQQMTFRAHRIINNVGLFFYTGDQLSGFRIPGLHTQRIQLLYEYGQRGREIIMQVLSQFFLLCLGGKFFSFYNLHFGHIIKGTQPAVISVALVAEQDIGDQHAT